MSASDLDWIKTAASALGVAGVLGYMLRYFMNKLDARDAESKLAIEKKDAIIASLIEKQAARDMTMMAALERIASAMDRMERHLDADRMNSGPHKRADLMGGT